MIRPAAAAAAPGPAQGSAGLPDGSGVGAGVQAGRDVVSLNLVTTFPEANYHRPPTQKADLGPVRLGLIPAGAVQPVAISGPIPYDNDTYLQTGGIVDVPYNPACAAPGDIATGTLVLLADQIEPPSAAPAVPCPTRVAEPILSEARSAYTLETDDQALFLNKGERATIHVLVRERGQAPAKNVTISLWEYQFGLSPAEPYLRSHSRLLRVEAGSPFSHRLGYKRHETFPAGQTTPLAIHVEALHPGSACLAFTMDGKPPWRGFPIGGVFYMGIRVLPEDDYSHVPPAEPRVKWDFYVQTRVPLLLSVLPGDVEHHPVQRSGGHGEGGEGDQAAHGPRDPQHVDLHAADPRPLVRQARIDRRMGRFALTVCSINLKQRSYERAGDSGTEPGASRWRAGGASARSC